jgi:hypothetical protein
MPDHDPLPFEGYRPQAAVRAVFRPDRVRLPGDGEAG